MTSRRLVPGILMAAAFTAAAEAHSLEDVNQDLSAKENYFQAIDREAPGFDLQDGTGRDVRLSDFTGKVVVLHFIYTNCPDVCPLHAEKIAEIQKMVNISPMKDRVQFISITTDPGFDKGQLLLDYGGYHGLDPVNWIFLTSKPGQPENTTRELAKSYGVEFKIAENGEQIHGVLTSVIDPKGRLRGRFHGMNFSNLNLVIFANALMNVAGENHEQTPSGWWGRLKEMF